MRGTCYSGWLANYWTSQTQLTGPPALNRSEEFIYWDWIGSSPAAGITVDNFCARWTGTVRPNTTETYTLRFRSDDGMRW
jgi:hypothetical protein